MRITAAVAVSPPCSAASLRWPKYARTWLGLGIGLGLGLG